MSWPLENNWHWKSLEETFCQALHVGHNKLWSKCRSIALLFPKGGHASRQARVMACHTSKQWWCGWALWSVENTQRPTHPPLRKNASDIGNDVVSRNLPISEQVHHDDSMNEFSCIVKPYMLATTSCEVSAEASHFFFQKGAMRLDTPFKLHCPLSISAAKSQTKPVHLQTHRSIQWVVGVEHLVKESHLYWPL